MKLLMPSHVKRVKSYVDPVPLFQRNGVEDQLAGMYQPIVQLKSGGYLVINPTEALVSIDINSGRSTREHNIEQTAYATNIEAAHEIARQLRLRDMAGLVVIDFIDMESNGHIRKVEKAMKEALKNDRARIQVGRISSFGLMEMSRQRLRTGMLEASTRPCPHCEGTGLMRTAASAGLSALRMLEDEAARGRGSRIILRAGREAAVYVLNKKRSEIAEVEERYGVSVEVMIDEALEGAKMSVESVGPPPMQRPRIEATAPAVQEDEDLLDEEDEIEEEDGEEDEAEDEPKAQRADQGRRPEGGRDEAEGDRGRKRRRRRGRRGGRRRGGEGEHPGEREGEQTVAAEDREREPAVEAAPAEVETEEPKVEEERKTRKRPRARRAAADKDAGAVPAELAEPVAVEAAEPVHIAAAETVAEPAAPAKRSRRRKAEPKAEELVAEPVPAPEPANDAEEAEPKPARRRSRARTAAAEAVAPAIEEPVSASADRGTEADENGNGTPRRGWWQRTFGA
jgi:ribonuclease E